MSAIKQNLENTLIEAHIKAWSEDAKRLNDIVATIRWDAISDESSANVEIVRMDNALKTMNPMRAQETRQAIYAGGICSFDIRLLNVNKTPEFEEYCCAVGAYMDAQEKIRAIPVDKIKEEGQKKLASLPNDATLADVADAVFQKHGIVDEPSIQPFIRLIKTKKKGGDHALINANSLINYLCGTGYKTKAYVEIFERATGIKLEKESRNRFLQINTWVGVASMNHAKINGSEENGSEDELLPSRNTMSPSSRC